MKGIMTAFLLSLPAASQAMGMHGGQGGCGPMAGNLMPVVVFAVIAALGYLVLQHADKQTHNCIRRTGLTLGGILIILGLVGFLCGIGHHIRMSRSRLCSFGPGSGTMMGAMQTPPPGQQPPAGAVKEAPAQAKKPETGAKK